MVYYWSNKTPAAPAGSRNVTFQSDGGSPEKRSAHVGPAGAGVPGVVPLESALDTTKFLAGDGSWRVPPSGGGGGGWVDRGDPATYDITLASLLTDNSWHDLDLSAIVPVGAKIIRLLLRTNPGTSSVRKIYFRKNGNSNTYSITGVEHETEWNYKTTVVDVFCDSNRIIEYLVSGTMNVLTIVVIGWYL